MGAVGEARPGGAAPPGDGRAEILARDYERVAGRGVKRERELSEAGSAGVELAAAVGRLLAAGFAAQQSGAIVLRRPEDCPGDFDDSVDARLRHAYGCWLRAGADDGADGACGGELLYGELGFWQHWWNMLRDRDHARQGPLLMDIVVPDDGSFAVRRWLEEFDPEVRSFALNGEVLRGRAIVPPQALGSAVEPMLDLSAESGIDVRVLSSEARFVLYDGAVAVLPVPVADVEGDGEGLPGAPEPHRAVRSRAIVDPLRSFFELLWRSAAPFSAYRLEHHRILALLSNGYTDARIAAELNISPRSVSRRVSEIMAEQGAGSRFELGARYGRSRP